jgi:transcriptional regulator with XRE-family HTH domain
MTRKNSTTKNLAEIIREELATDSELARTVEQERLHADIAQQIVELRTKANLTQTELAERAGTKQSVISRIEDADYYGHSLKMLARIAEVLDRRIYVAFVTRLASTPSVMPVQQRSSAEITPVTPPPVYIPARENTFAIRAYSSQPMIGSL